MISNFRNTGISDIGSLAWGTHLCQVYKDKQDLLDTLPAYFKAGLENNEYCIWITPASITLTEAEDALRKIVPDLDSYIQSGQIEIIPYDQWYLRGGCFDGQRVTDDWLAKLADALENSYEGMRLSGDASWLCESDRDAFADYEATINAVVGKHPIVALCTYPFDSCAAVDIADAMATHELTLMEGRGRHLVWENPDYRETRQALRKSNERLALLSEATASLLTSDNPESLIRPLAERVLEHLGCDVFFNYLATPGQEHLRLNAYAGIPEEEALQVCCLCYGEAVCGVVGETGETIVVNDIPHAGDSRTGLVSSYGVRAYACTPLLSHRGGLLGTLSFGRKSSDSFKPDEIDLVQTLAKQIASALERNTAEETLRTSESRFRALFDNSPDAVFLTEPEGVIKAANPAASAMFGMTEEEICRVGRAGLADPNDSRHIWALEERKHTGSLVNVELNYIRKGGEKFPAEVSSVVLAGDPAQAFVVVRDITERKRAETALRASEERLARTQQFSMVMPLHVSLDGRWQKLPPTFAEFLGYDREEELLGREFREFTHPDDFPADWSQVQRLIAGEIKSFEMEKRFIRRDGSSTWGYLNCSVVTDEQGKPVHLLTYVRDINEEKRMEQEREELLLREQHIAETLQHALVPPSVPARIGDYRIAVRYRPALKEAEVGGDFYDVFEVGRGKIALLIGDVAGKGLAAAIRVAAARYGIRGYAYLDPRPGRVLELANDLLCRDENDEVGMLTASLVIIDTELGMVTYASAGHESPVLVGADGIARELRASGMPLGVVPQQSYEEKSQRLNCGARIAMVTDGITEARAEGVVLFEKHRVLSCLEQMRAHPPEDAADCLLDMATEHAGGQLQDDAAIVVVDWLSEGGCKHSENGIRVDMRGGFGE